MYPASILTLISSRAGVSNPVAKGFGLPLCLDASLMRLTSQEN